jgi:hypothetical protein
LIEHEIINNENLDSFIKKALSTNLNELDETLNKNQSKNKDNLEKDYTKNNLDNIGLKFINIFYFFYENDYSLKKDYNDDEEPSEASAFYSSNLN